MAEENFFDHWVNSSKKKKQNLDNEIIFSLTEYSKNGCNYCLQSKCNQHHGELAKDVHYLAKNIVRNPSIILGDFKEILKNNDIETSNKKFHINTCVWNYTHSTCQNCSDGRFKMFNWTDDNGNVIPLKFCFPILKENSNVIPIGIHWDIEIKIKNNKIIKDYTKVMLYDGKKSKNQNDKNISVEEVIENKDIIDIENKEINDIENKNSYPDLSEKNTNKDDNKKITVWDYTNSKIKEASNTKSDDNSQKPVDLNKTNINKLEKKKCTEKVEINNSKNNETETTTYSISELNDKIKYLNSKIQDYENEYRKISTENKKLKNELQYSKKAVIDNQDKENLKKATKYFSNVIFDSMLNTHYT